MVYFKCVKGINESEQIKNLRLKSSNLPEHILDLMNDLS